MEILKKIWNVVSTVLVILMVICAVFLMGSRVMGYEVYTVISGSMEPTYGVGDLLYVKDVDPDAVKVGDPITFVMNEDLVVQQINPSALKMFGLKNANDILHEHVIRILSPEPYVNIVNAALHSTTCKHYLADYGRYVDETILYDRQYHVVITLIASALKCFSYYHVGKLICFAVNNVNRVVKEHIVDNGFKFFIGKGFDKRFLSVCVKLNEYI